jgi:hypothetical protein
MVIEKSLKDARGYGRSGYDVFAEISQGVRPTLAEQAKPANWLPVVLEDKYHNEWWTVLAGTIMGMNSAISGTPRLVPAVGGSAMTITYGDNDVGYTVSADDITNLVAAAGAAGATIIANRPIGWAWHHYYAGSIEDRLINYELQPTVSILCDYEIELALIDDTAAEQNFVHGSLVKPGVTGTRGGIPHLWVNGSDSVDLICGRVLFRATIPTGTSSRSRIDLVKPVKGFGLSGVESEGRPRHLDSYTLAAPTVKASEFVRINITLL